GPTGQVAAICLTWASWPGAGTRSALLPAAKSLSVARAWMVVTPARRRASFSVPVMYGSRERSSRSADHFRQNSLYRQPSHLKERQNGTFSNGAWATRRAVESVARTRSWADWT